MNIDLDKFFDDYRPIVHLTKEDFNIWYNNLQKDLAKLIKLDTLSKPSVVSEQTEFLEKVSKKSEEMLAIMEKHNIVIDNLDDKMQKFAFTVYSELVQLSEEAKNLLKS